jgi:hypothetical protein
MTWTCKHKLHEYKERKFIYRNVAPVTLMRSAHSNSRVTTHRTFKRCALTDYKMLTPFSPLSSSFYRAAIDIMREANRVRLLAQHGRKETCCEPQNNLGRRKYTRRTDMTVALLPSEKKIRLEQPKRPGLQFLPP